MVEACAGWTDKSGNHPDCQFGDEAADHKFDGKDFCRFHLPMGEPEEGGKADWDNEQQAAITDALIDRIKAKISAEFEKPEDQRRELDFRGVVVPELFHLDKERIWALDMRGAQFHGDAQFSEARFYGGAQFGGVQFYGDARFGTTHYEKDAEFSEAQFHGDAQFSEARFHGGAQFGGVQFYGYARFGVAQFEKDAEFSEAQFHGDAQFGSAKFRSKADFGVARFHGDGCFREAQLYRLAEFREAQFHQEAQFEEVQFHGEADFDEAQFHGDALFSGSANPAQSQARQFNITSFRRALFGARAIFSNREFRDQTDFSGCVFKRAPIFHGSILHQDTAFGKVKFQDVTSRGADRAYRTLRHAMEGHRARAEEGMFYTLEQKARRRNMHRFDPAYWMSLGYEFGSNYGFSIVRPFVWLVVGIFASAALLLGFVWNSGVCTDHATMFKEALLFSARQLFLPFDALRSTDKVLAAYAFNPGGTGWLRLWGVALTLFEGLSALLLVLAVRWRYRR